MVDGVVECGAQDAALTRPESRGFILPFGVRVQGHLDGLARWSEIAEEPETVAEAHQKGLIHRCHHRAEKIVQIPAVFLDEIGLAPAPIDEQPESQREPATGGEERNALANAVFPDFEVILGEFGNHATLRVAHAERHVHQLHLGPERSFLRQGRRGDAGPKTGRNEWT